MGRRYYCDFCEKSFADNPTNRRNHVRGVQHKQSKKQHYDSFRDPETILSEENSKRPCRKYMQSGYCEFGASCRFSHMSPTSRQELEELVKQRNQKKREKQNEELLKLEDWLSKKNLNPSISSNAPEPNSSSFLNEKIILPLYSIPETLLPFHNLPPSMLPPSPNVFEEFTPSEWG